METTWSATEPTAMDAQLPEWRTATDAAVELPDLDAAGDPAPALTPTDPEAETVAPDAVTEVEAEAPPAPKVPTPKELALQQQQRARFETAQARDRRLAQRQVVGQPTNAVWCRLPPSARPTQRYRRDGTPIVEREPQS